MPFYSIICPLYNAEKYLDTCIKSVLDQTFTNWEMILVDDGSEDESLKKAGRWVKQDERIRVLQHPGTANKGVSASRNLGIKHANGTWVAFLDADDVWLPEKLKKQQEVICQYEKKDLVLVYCLASVIDEEGNPISDKNRTKSHNNIFGFYGAGQPGLQIDAFRWAVNKGFEAPTSTVRCKKELVNELGGFEEDMHFSEDALMWYRMLEIGSIYFMDESLVHYRVHLTQWNASATSKLKLTRRFIVYERLIQKTDKKNKPCISFLLVNKGFRIIVRSNIGYPYLDFRIIVKYWKRLLKDNEISTAHKTYSFIIPVIEIMILPVRLIRAIIK